MFTNIEDTISENVKKFGFYKIEKWLEEEDINKSKKIIKKINSKKGEYKGIYVNRFKHKLIEILKLNLKKYTHMSYFANLGKKMKLKEIADKILQTESRLLRIDCYVHPISDKPVLSWHCDRAYSGQLEVSEKNFIHPEDYSIKFFFYLNDVDKDNGCLGYLPHTHSIANAIKKGIYRKDIKYSPYWSLNDFKGMVEKNYDYLKNMVNQKFLDKFLNETYQETLKENHKYNLEVKTGGAIVFNESGIHKGNKTSKTERYALRFFYCIKQFV